MRAWESPRHLVFLLNTRNYRLAGEDVLKSNFFLLVVNLIDITKINSGDLCPFMTLSTYLSTHLSLLTLPCSMVCTLNPSMGIQILIQMQVTLLLFESRSEWAACWNQSTESLLTNGTSIQTALQT